MKDSYDPIAAGTIDHAQIAGHDIKLPPAPAGYWDVGGSGIYVARFAVEKKPPFVHRWFAQLLLGWKWVDAGKGRPITQIGERMDER